MGNTGESLTACNNIPLLHGSKNTGIRLSIPYILD